MLFLDELPEFGRTALESLRQPMEDKVFTVSRGRGGVREHNRSQITGHVLHNRRSPMALTLQCS